MGALATKPNIEVMSNGDVIDFGEVKQFKLQPIERHFEKYGKAIESERLVKKNLNKIAEFRMKHGDDFLITNPQSVGKNGEKTIDGIFSPKFGVTQFDDQLGTKDMYRCQCGAVAGAIYIGKECNKCNTVVTFVDADLTRMGWIPLKKYSIMNAGMFIHVQDLIGKPNLKAILKVDVSKMNSEGRFISKPDKKNPFAHIGMIEFEERFDEILDFYLKKYPKKREIYDLIKENQSCVFTHYIPVYSAILRPRIENNEKIRSLKANVHYDTIMRHYDAIQQDKGNLLTIVPALFEIQYEFMELYDFLVTGYSGKSGLFRSHFGGLRIDYGARSVIINGKDLRPDEVDIPYVSAITFLELEILYLLRKIDDITETEANQILNKAMREFNPKIWHLCQNIISKSRTPMSVLVNRPPSLSDRSYRLLRVKGVKSSIEDLTLSISPALLSGFAGDYDGDSLSYSPIKDWRLIKTLEPIFSPRYNYISRTNGRYSSRMAYIKDYAIILSELYSLADVA